jgi:undecaprenyl diphosphate synthase
LDKLPEHIGIVMDGNRRWAKKRGLPSSAGHRKGAEIFKARAGDLSELGIKHATFFVFSTENLKRKADEISTLTRLFEDCLDDFNKNANDANIRLLIIGDLSVFSDKLVEKAREAERLTAGNNGTVCRLAFNYGARAEIVRAARLIAGDAERGVLSASDLNALTEESVSDYLYTRGAPDADLIIRTGGERRLSNFLLWQAAYAELYFTDTLWCDFTKGELIKALEDYAGRSRRFGN